MGVYFIYRSPYNLPNLKFVKRFPHNSVIEWFQDFHQKSYIRIKKEMTETGDCDIEEIANSINQWIGIEVYGLDITYADCEDFIDDYIECPENRKDVIKLLNEFFIDYYKWDTEHFLQVLTDDDEIHLAYYLVDDHYLQQYPAKMSYFIYPEYELPHNYLEKISVIPNNHIKIFTNDPNKDCSTYCLFFTTGDDGADLWGLMDKKSDYTNGVYRVTGAEIQDLPIFLSKLIPDDSIPEELLLLRMQILTDSKILSLKESLDKIIHIPYFNLNCYNILKNKDLTEATVKFEKAVTALKENMKSDDFHSKDVFGSKLSKVICHDHICQVSFHYQTWGNENLFDHWVFFDDYWASANFDLAISLINYASKWYIDKGY